MRICIYANGVPNWHKRDHLISRRTSTVAQFRIPIESCEVSTSQNKALINAFHMSAPLADDVQTSLGAGLRCKDTTKFADVQILSGKSFRNFKSYKVIGLFGEIDKSTISVIESTFFRFSHSDIQGTSSSLVLLWFFLGL